MGKHVYFCIFHTIVNMHTVGFVCTTYIYKLPVLYITYLVMYNVPHAVQMQQLYFTVISTSGIVWYICMYVAMYVAMYVCVFHYCTCI